MFWSIELLERRPGCTPDRPSLLSVALLEDEITITFGTGKITGQCFTDSICVTRMQQETSLIRHYVSVDLQKSLLPACNRFLP